MSTPSLISTLADLATLRARPPLTAVSVRGCPHGHGEPVLVLPGLLGSDSQTRRFRDGLQMLDYMPLRWELGINLGPSPNVMEALAARVSKLAAAHGRLRLVGFGMGGMLARWVAQARTAAVCGVVTVNTPFRNPIDRAFGHVSPLLRGLSGVDIRGVSFMIRQPPAASWAAIYSRQDGIVAWNACLDPAYQHLCFEVGSTHMTCMRNQSVFQQVTECLMF